MEGSDSYRFPPDFLWGTATAAYQIEGSPAADGRGPSIWDTFSHTPGKIKNGDTGDVADDHYHRWQQDIALMRELGLDAYRFSVSWPRILPAGRGAVNVAGLDFYDRLVDALLAAGIKPFVTLYHWDLPQALQDKGGWANRDTVAAFVEYAHVVSSRLGDRVTGWITHNEPWVVSFLANYIGEHAPGLHDLPTAVQVAHHLLLSHGQAVPVLRAASPGAQVGITLNLSPIHPASDSPEDQQAARLTDGFINRWFLDPLKRGEYPADMLEVFGAAQPPVQAGDMETISTPIDFLGINNYTRNVVRGGNSDNLLGGEPISPEGEYTTMNWEVYPDGLREILERVHRDYGFPAYYVTENGAAFPDVLDPDGHVHDPRRQAYLEGYIGAVAQAIHHGVPVRGYFVWSFMDNFEWAQGYSQRFGIIYVDYASQCRFWKDSARWYQQFLAAQHAAK